ncbi:MAG TPA: hypothetical protein VMR31_05755 [Myxococcota bacterium]|nr:hypothetical protein [Myxococcota bacterium]
MSARTSAAGLVAALLGAIGLAGSAAAFPVLFDGAGGFGVSASTASAAEAAGFALISDVTVVPAASDGLTIPAPDVLSAHIVTSPSVTNPNTAQSRWSVTNGGASDLANAWLVFFGPVTYTASKVGIDLQPGGQWAIVEVSAGASGDYFYPAVFLGDLDVDGTQTFLMNHVVGQALTQQGSTLILPQYSVGAFAGVPVPEPGLFVLLSAGLALAAAVRPRKD